VLEALEQVLGGVGVGDVLTINLLQALPKTPLWDRLQREGRLLHDASLESNVLFKRPHDTVVSSWRRAIAHAYTAWSRLIVSTGIADLSMKSIRFCSDLSESESRPRMMPEVLELMRQANFMTVFVGIETPEADALKGIDKTHNAAVPMYEGPRAASWAAPGAG
jgi:radical SAM superfamily enzyme YgiQ (UPF0313 family)